jgi:hypothetical protein
MVKSESSKQAGDVFWVLHEVCMASLLMLLAKGWTVYRPTIRSSSMYKLVGFMSVYCIVFLALLVAERKLHDEEMITWRWDSSPGTAFCLVYFLAWGVFAYYIYHTMTPEKKDQYMVNTSADTAMVCPEDKFVFFKYFFIIYTIWFIMFPVSIFALRDSAPAFTRENMAWLVNSIRQSLGIAVLAAMWMPWHENLRAVDRTAVAGGAAAAVVAERVELEADAAILATAAAATVSPGRSLSIVMTDWI